MLALALGGFAMSSHAQNMFSPRGGEYRVIGEMAGDQVHSHAAIGDGGGFVVWQDNATDGDGMGISARKLDANLSGVFGTFRVNTIGEGDQMLPQVALLKNGGAVFVWQGGARGNSQIYARFMGSNGTFSTSDILVSDFAGKQQRTPVVAVLDDGNVAIAWASIGQEGIPQGYSGVFARIFTPAGVKVTGEIPVNIQKTYNQRNPAIATLPGGKFAVVWVSEDFRGVVQAVDETGLKIEEASGLDVYDVSIQGRIFGANGQALSSEIRLNKTDRICANPSIAVSGDDFAVVWGGKKREVMTVSDRRDAPTWEIYGRVFQQDGTPKTDDILVNSFTFGDQYQPRLAATATEFFVTWASFQSDGSWEGICGRVLGKAGSLLSREFRVNTTAYGRQQQPALVSDGQENYLALWSSFTGGPASYDLYGQRFTSSMALPLPAAPFVTAVTQTRLSVTWPELAGYPGVKYELYVDGNSSPIVVSENVWIAKSLEPGTSHTFRLAYLMPDGRRSTLSEGGSGTTWGEDNNFDGLPDDWQERHWGSDRNQWPAGNADSDGDGATNIQELLAGTDPTDLNSVLRAEIVVKNGGRQLVWNTEPGSIYQVEVSAGLSTWTSYGPQRFAFDKTDSIPLHTANGMEIYRVIRIR